MKAFCIFNDFPEHCAQMIRNSGVELTCVEMGKPRPTEEEMKLILEEYDIVIIGTSQKIRENMWENISAPRIIATASAGVDHIEVPEDKRVLLTVINTPTANVQSVAEYTIGAMLLSRKRFFEGNALYSEGQDNKKLSKKPEDIEGAVVGLVGAGRISTRIMELLSPFGVKFLCYTKNPLCHTELSVKYGVEFVSLEKLAEESDVISVNLPNDTSTKGLINTNVVDMMKNSCIYVSVSRAETADILALIKKAENNSNFYVVLDLDVAPEYVGKSNGRNIIFTPHIAGGTIESRRRMFSDVSQKLIECVEGFNNEF